MRLPLTRVGTDRTVTAGDLLAASRVCHRSAGGRARGGYLAGRDRDPGWRFARGDRGRGLVHGDLRSRAEFGRSEEHTSELQSRENLVCRLLLEKKKKRS